jgi:hypothetical protein
VWACSMKSELLRLGIWLDNDDMWQPSFLCGLDCFGGWAYAGDGTEDLVWKFRW